MEVVHDVRHDQYDENEMLHRASVEMPNIHCVDKDRRSRFVDAGPVEDVDGAEDEPE